MVLISVFCNEIASSDLAELRMLASMLTYSYYESLKQTSSSGFILLLISIVRVFLRNSFEFYEMLQGIILFMSKVCIYLNNSF